MCFELRHFLCLFTYTLAVFCFCCFFLCLLITKTHIFKYIENFTTKNLKFSDKNYDIFPISAQNRLWVLVRTASPRRFYQVLKIYVLAEIRKIMYTPVNPSFTIQKWGLRGSKLYRYVFVTVLSRFTVRHFSCLSCLLS